VRGREDFVKFGLMLFDTFAECSHDVKDLFDAGEDRVVGIGTAIFRSKPGGTPVGVDWIRSFELEDGMIRRSITHPDLESALKEARKS
jgi:hypothetical protein